MRAYCDTILQNLSLNILMAQLSILKNFSRTVNREEGGRWRLVGYSPWGRKESGMTEWHFHFSASDKDVS